MVRVAEKHKISFVDYGFLLHETLVFGSDLNTLKRIYFKKQQFLDAIKRIEFFLSILSITVKLQIQDFQMDFENCRKQSKKTGILKNLL